MALTEFILTEHLRGRGFQALEGEQTFVPTANWATVTLRPSRFDDKSPHAFRGVYAVTTRHLWAGGGYVEAYTRARLDFLSEGRAYAKMIGERPCPIGLTPGAGGAMMLTSVDTESFELEEFGEAPNVTRFFTGVTVLTFCESRTFTEA
jgi:hypothetical protein